MEIKIKGQNNNIEIEKLKQALIDKNVITDSDLTNAEIKIRKIKK